jgi:hypothetical protein
VQLFLITSKKKAMKNFEQLNMEELNAAELKDLQGGALWLLPLIIVPFVLKNCK